MSAHSRIRAFLEFTAIALVGYALKLALDQIVWRYSGPISLVIMLGVIFWYLRRRNRPLTSIGLVPLTSVKNYVLLLPQIALAFISIIAAGLTIGYGGEALGLEFMKPDDSGARERFGDLAGNTPLYLSWLAVLWIAGPAEELYFRGFMISQLREAFGRSRFATVLSILIPAVIFGIGHMYYMGPRGFFMTGAIGVTMGILFFAYKRNIWPLMIAHAAFNSLTFTAIYMEWDI